MIFLNITNISGSNVRVSGYTIIPGATVMVNEYTSEIDALKTAGSISVGIANAGTLPSSLTTGGLLKVDTTGIPIYALQLTATSTSANTNLNSVTSTTVTRLTMYARNADIRFNISTSATSASATTSHFIAMNERLDLQLPSTPNIAIIRDSAATSNGILEISTLS